MEKGIPEASRAILRQWQAQGLKFNWLGSPGEGRLGFDSEIEDYEIVEQPIPEKLLQEPITKKDIEQVYGKQENPYREESDPNGLDPHTPGAKLDAGKNRLGLVLGGFARALEQVGRAGTGGAVTYSDNGWKEVDDALARYEDAMLRHWVEIKKGNAQDLKTGLLHQAHLVWNALAVLELMLKEPK